MSSSSRALIVAATVGAVEVLKDQGFCRWNYTFRSLHQYVKNNGSFSQTRKLSSSSSSSSSSSIDLVMKLRNNDEKLKQSEESLRKVMYLSCRGPN